MLARFHDPQLRRDGLWIAVAAATVLPVTALPLLLVAASASMMGVDEGAVIAGLLIAAFAWRIFGPLAPKLLGPDPRKRVNELETIGQT